MKIHEAIAKGGTFCPRRSNLGIAIMAKMRKDKMVMLNKIEQSETKKEIRRMKREEDEIEQRPIGFAKIILEEVAKVHGYTLESMVKKCRLTHVKTVRHIASWIAYKSSPVSLQVLGDILQRNHATILHSQNFITNCIETNDKSVLSMLDRTLTELTRKRLITSKLYYYQIEKK